MAFLVGFLSQSQSGVAYIHFVGVDPSVRRQGVGKALYRRFFAEAFRRGARRVKCITSPGNTTSLGFHLGLGFELEPGDTTIDSGVWVHRDYDGPGLDRIVFTRQLGEGDQV